MSESSNRVLFVTGLWEANAKYGLRSYLILVPRVLNAIANRCRFGDRDVEIIFFTDEHVKNKILNTPGYRGWSDGWKDAFNLKFHMMSLDDLPEVPSVCSWNSGLKLGWRIPQGKMNLLNRIWCNKLYLMKTAAELEPTHSNIVWYDAGLKVFHRHFPNWVFDRMQDGKYYSNRYGADTIGGPRLVYPGQPVHRGGLGPEGVKLVPSRAHMQPYNVKHNGCKYPHFIRAGVMGAKSATIIGMYDRYRETLSRVGGESECWDEETILSAMFLDTPELFDRWISLYDKT